MNKKLLSVILCCYNEEENIKAVISALHGTLKPSGYNYEIIIVDDGSTDHTLNEVKDLSLQDEHIYFIELSRNFGHQNALKAGLDYARGDAIICMDADMQHPPELLKKLIEKWKQGYDVVYTRRLDSEGVSGFKRKTSALFYRLMNLFSDIEIEQGTADFRLLDRKVADVIIRFEENDLFMRGIAKWVGFKQYALDYTAPCRQAGKSKYVFRKMTKLAVGGFTSFSVRPLYVALYIGLFLTAFASLFIFYVLYQHFFGNPVSGWASTVIIIIFFGGLQLSILGIIGLYLGKLFMQAKQRPRYIVRDTNLQAR